MDRNNATRFLRQSLDSNGLQDWHVRLNTSMPQYYGLCDHKNKTIILQAQYIDIAPEPLVINTIRHEIAHALTPGHKHDETWQSKAKELGCIEIKECSTFALPDDVL